MSGAKAPTVSRQTFGRSDQIHFDYGFSQRIEDVSIDVDQASSELFEVEVSTGLDVGTVMQFWLDVEAAKAFRALLSEWIVQREQMEQS